MLPSCCNVRPASDASSAPPSARLCRCVAPFTRLQCPVAAVPCHSCVPKRLAERVHWRDLLSQQGGLEQERLRAAQLPPALDTPRRLLSTQAAALPAPLPPQLASRSPVRTATPSAAPPCGSSASSRSGSQKQETSSSPGQAIVVVVPIQGERAGAQGSSRARGAAGPAAPPLAREATTVPSCLLPP